MKRLVCALAYLCVVSAVQAQDGGWPPTVDIPASRPNLSEPLMQQNYEIMAECEGHLESQSDILDIALLDLDQYQKTESGLSRDESDYIQNLKGKIIEAGDNSRQVYEMFRDLRVKLNAMQNVLDHDAAKEDYARARRLWAPYYEQPGGELVDIAKFNPTGMCLNAYNILANWSDNGNE